MIRAAALAALLLPAVLAPPAIACDAAPAPVGALAYGSRYADDSDTRSEIDEDGEAEADAALKPIDDFLRDLTARANDLLRADAKADAADCLIGQMAVWAGANAMGDLQSKTAGLTIGSRLAGFALVMLQVAPHSTRPEDVAAIKRWLAGLMQAQMLFWEEQAPRGSAQGNLRAWAALGGAATARLTGDAAMRGWAAASVAYVLCKAEPDGSLPQEMRRGRLALKYQLHAIAPLVPATLLLTQDGLPLSATCDNALQRVVAFALADLETGARTQAITGKEQSFFDGSDVIEGFHLAWIVPYGLLDPSAGAQAKALADRYGALNYSKLGGNQTLLWQALQ